VDDLVKLAMTSTGFIHKLLTLDRCSITLTLFRMQESCPNKRVRQNYVIK
jgi:hypothetical protein